VAYLHFEDRGSTLFSYQIGVGRTVIGRSDRCDVALPSTKVSRVHCRIDGRAGVWELVDRSTHGTFINGVRVDRHELADGDRVLIGEHSAVFRLHGPEDGATSTSMSRPSAHEAVVDLGEQGVTTQRAELVISSDGQETRRVVLDREMLWLGGNGSDLVVHPEVARHAVKVVVSAGRVMLEPGAVAVHLHGARLRRLTPVLPGESFFMADVRITVGQVLQESGDGRASSFGDMVGESAVIRRAFTVLAKIASHHAPILIVGDTGTGKELAAKGVHDHGVRTGGPFEAVNCAAIPESMVESELFGHEKGSFTGATSRQDGAFHRADGGTLFLDEIGELRLDAQAKLLRALESGEVRRLGASERSYPDVRVVAATHRNLWQMVREGSFREDLYYRLAVLTVQIPPLRDRKDDIPVIARALLSRYHHGAQLAESAEATLQGYDWPGNIRELRNVLTRAVVLGGPVIQASDLEFRPWTFEGEAPSQSEFEAVERERILRVLRACKGNKTRAARELGMARTSLAYKLRRMGVGT